MRVPFGDNIRSLGGRLRPINWLAVAERLLLALLAMQCARLIWVVLTPVGSFGPWEGRQAQFPSVAARQALFSTFDPFYRSGPAQQGSGVVTSLALTVYGIRLNEGSGLGSAIVAGPDGVQNSYAVGDEILPGVMLKAVAFDHVTIDRGGAEEQVFLDQSSAAPSTPAGANPSLLGPTGTDSPTADGVKRDIGFTPRLQAGRVTGMIVSPKGPGFQAAGFQAGDIITQVDGQPVTSISDLQSLQAKIVPGARLSVTVERGASMATINLILQGQ